MYIIHAVRITFQSKINLNEKSIELKRPVVGYEQISENVKIIKCT